MGHSLKMQAWLETPNLDPKEEEELLLLLLLLMGLDLTTLLLDTELGKRTSLLLPPLLLRLIINLSKINISKC